LEYSNIMSKLRGFVKIMGNPTILWFARNLIIQDILRLSVIVKLIGIFYQYVLVIPLAPRKWLFLQGFVCCDCFRTPVKF